MAIHVVLYDSFMGFVTKYYRKRCCERWSRGICYRCKCTSKGTTNGTITDFEGGFTLNLPSNSVIVVSFVGYKTQEISVAGKTDLTVTLTEDTQLLGNVVVVGYGTQKKEDLTSAIATLSPKEVLKSPGGITDALQGSTAGVNVSGEKIRIRGTGSITGSTDPLWVVDGIIDASGNIPNDDEIESIQVLKDAASCAIYGVRGANGVIVVTTKKVRKVNRKSALTLMPVSELHPRKWT